MISPCLLCLARAAVVTSTTDPDRRYAAVVRCCGCGWLGPRRTGQTRLAAERRAIRAWRMRGWGLDREGNTSIPYRATGRGRAARTKRSKPQALES